MEKIILENTNWKTSGVVILISDKIEPKAKHINRKNKSTLIEDKRSNNPLRM